MAYDGKQKDNFLFEYFYYFNLSVNIVPILPYE